MAETAWKPQHVPLPRFLHSEWKKMTRIHILPLPWIASLITLMANLLPTQTNAPPCGGKIIHQGKAYATVQVGNQCWLAENLQASPSTPREHRSHCSSRLRPGANKCFLPRFARLRCPGQSTPVILYNRWAAAKACPQGWHLPTPWRSGMRWQPTLAAGKSVATA